MNNIQKEVVTLPPFKRICMTIGELPSSYLETMTYYEMLVWFTKYLQDTVIPAINNNAEAVTELQGLFTELQNYVKNYFDNLDVQEEINNKLDDMAESGQLTDIIAQYLGLAGMIAFDTVADMKEAQNLVNGSKCRTLGFHSVNDGGGAYYKIRQVTNDDVIDEMTLIEVYDNLLVAELIIPDEVNVEMFGAIGDGTTDDKLAIRKALSVSKHVNFDGNKTYAIGFDLEDYTFNEVITKRANYLVIANSIVINGNNATLKLITNPCGIYNGIRIELANNVNIKNINIIGDREQHVTTYLINNYNGEWGHCLTVINSTNIVLENINVSKAWGDGLNIGENSEHVIVENCISDNSRRNGLTITSSQNVHATNCIFKNTTGVAPQAGVDIEPNAVSGIKLKDIILDKCYSYNNLGTGFEVNATAFSKIETTDEIDVKIINCKTESCHDGITYLAIPSSSAQLYNYKGTVLFDNCYILNPSANGCHILFEKPEKTAQCIINECIFDGYGNKGINSNFTHSTDTDNVWGGAIIRNSKFINVPNDTGMYKCAIMWGAISGANGRCDLIVDKCHVDDPNPLNWGAIAVGKGKIEWDTKPIVIKPQEYTHAHLNGLLIANRANNVGFFLPSRLLTNREYEVYCVTGTSCYIGRYGYGDSSITTDDKIMSTANTAGADYFTLNIAKRVKLVPYDTNLWIATD